MFLPAKCVKPCSGDVLLGEAILQLAPKENAATVELSNGTLFVLFVLEFLFCFEGFLYWRAFLSVVARVT